MITTLILSLFIAPSTSTSTSTGIELWPSAAVRGTRITLGSVASIEAADSSLAALLADFELGTAPTPGFSRYLTRDQIQADLRRAFPGHLISVAGEAGCHIEPRVERVSAERLLTAAREEIEGLFSSRDAEYSLDGQLADLDVPEGLRPAELRIAAFERQLRGGRLSVPVEVRVDGATWQTVWTHWRVGLWESLPVLARALPRGTRLSANHFETRRVDLARLGTAAALDASSSIGALLRRDLTAGTVITENDVERPQVISRGALLQLAIHSGSITARTMVHAQEAGRIGEHISVIQVDSGKELLAMVRSAELVEIRLGH
jgi:flagella basal body P-ring formation protein FlgA